MDFGVVFLFAVIAFVVIVAISRFSDQSKPTTPSRTLPRPPFLPPPSIKNQIYNSNELIKAKVRKIFDGDTILVSTFYTDNICIRLSSIDSPEDGQDWGDNARAGLMKLIEDRDVQIELHGEDMYDRTVATVYLWNGVRAEWMNVSERMVMLGHAWVMRQYYGHLPKKRQQQLDRLEKWAKSKRIGLWGTENPIPPWEWRIQKGIKTKNPLTK